jgi:hypothetical protein
MEKLLRLEDVNHLAGPRVIKPDLVPIDALLVAERWGGGKGKGMVMTKAAHDDDFDGGWWLW